MKDKIDILSSIGFIVTKPQKGPHFKFAHAHQDIEINYILDGEIRYLIGDQIHRVLPHQPFIFWGGYPHQVLEKSIDIEGVWITLPLFWSSHSSYPNHFQQHLLQGKIIEVQHQNALQQTIQTEQFKNWLKFYQSQKQDNIRIILLELEAWFIKITQNLSFSKSSHQHSDKSIEKIVEVTNYLSKNYYRELNLEEIAQHIGLHPKYLCQIFKKQCGTSLWNYLSHLRIAHAQHLLVSTNLSILDIAYKVGFQSLTPFYLAFKKFNPKEKPLDFRKRCSHPL